MNASRSLQPLLLAVVLLSTTSYALADGNLGLWLLAAPGAVLAWWLTRGEPPRTVPRSLINAMLMGAVGWAALRVVRDRFEVEVFSEFVTLILVIKLLDRRLARDDAQVLTLSAFLAVGAMLTSNAFGVGIVLFLFLPVLLLAVVLQQIDAAARRAPADRFARRDRARGLGRDLRRLIGVGWVAAMGLSVGAFVLMPRSLGTSAFGQWGNASVGSVVGFNDEITLGTGGLISQSAEPVLDVRILDAEGQNAGAPLRTFYLRGAVLDSYRNGRWVRDEPVRRADNDRGAVAFGSSSPILIGGTPSDFTYELRVTMRQASRSGTHLFTIWRPERLQMHTPVRSLYHDMDDATLLVTGQEGKVEYTVWADDVEATLGRNLNPDEPVRGGWPRDVLKVSSERVTALAAGELAAEGIAVDPAERDESGNVAAARRLESYFTRERFVYDLDERVTPRGEDPTEYFLFESRTGHCEYYASAMAALARGVGLSVRVVTGYVASEFNETTGFYLVRASNAHAWVEVEVAPGRWRRFDPTPPEDFGRLHEQRDAGVLGWFRRAFETVEFTWIRAVVGFDDAARDRLFGGSLPSGRDLTQSASVLLDRLQSGGTRLIGRAAGRATVAFATVFVVGTLVSLAWGRWGALLLTRIGGIGWRRRDAGIPDAALVERGRRVLRRAFRRLGMSRPAWRPLVTHASLAGGVEGVDAGVSEALSRVARVVYRLRFGRVSLDASERARLEADLEMLRGIRRRVRRGVGR